MSNWIKKKERNCLSLERRAGAKSSPIWHRCRRGCVCDPQRVPDMAAFMPRPIWCVAPALSFIFFDIAAFSTLTLSLFSSLLGCFLSLAALGIPQLRLHRQISILAGQTLANFFSMFFITHQWNEKIIIINN